MLLEREAQLGELARLVDDLAIGRGGLVLLEGPAGVGKTSLVLELRDQARTAGARVLTARAAELEQSIGFGVVRQLLEPVVLGADDAARAALLSGAAAHAAPVLEDVPGAEADGLRALHGLHWLVANLAETVPVLLLVDDAHWADEISLRWLSYLARRAEELSVLIAVAHRPVAGGPVAARLDELSAEPRATLVSPRPLSAAAIAQLAAEQWGAAADPAFAAAVERVTAGNPFFVRELLRAAHAEGLAPAEASAARLEVLTPDRVTRVVAQRIASGGSAAVAVADALAVLGRAAALDRIALLAEVPDDAALQAVSALERLGIVRAELDVDFVHPLVRSAVLDGLDYARAVALRVKTLTTLAASGAELEQLAAHVLELPPGTGADALGRTPASVLVDAARASLGRGAADAAATYLDRALREPLDDAARHEATVLRAHSERMRFGPRTLALFTEATASAPDGATRARIAREGVEGLTFGGEFRAARRLAEEALAGGTLPDGDRETLEAEVLACRLMDLADSAAARPAFAELEARAAAGETLHPAMRAALGLQLTVFGVDVVRGMEVVCDVLVNTDLARAKAGIVNGAVLAASTGDRPAALDAWFDGFFHGLREDGRPDTFVLLSMMRGTQRLRRGDLLGAEADLRAVVEVTEVEVPAIIAWTLAPLALTLVERGAAAEAEALVAAHGGPDPWPPLFQFVWLRYARGVVRHAAGDHAAALADLLACGELAGPAGVAPHVLPWRSAAALVHRDLGDDAAAQTLAAEEADLAARTGVPAAIGRAGTVAALSAGDAGRLQAAVDVLHGSGAELDLARAEIELGAALRRTGTRAAARDALVAGTARAERCGAVVLTRRGRDELQRVGARIEGEPVTARAALTPAERRVVELAMTGLRNREIAQALFLTQKTVETHLSSAYRKLGIRTRNELAGALTAA